MATTKTFPLNDLANDQSLALNITETPSPLPSSPPVDITTDPFLLRLNNARNHLPNMQPNVNTDASQCKRNDIYECVRPNNIPTNNSTLLLSDTTAVAPATPAAAIIENLTSHQTLTIEPYTATQTTTMMNGCDKISAMSPTRRSSNPTSQKRIGCRDVDVDYRKGAANVPVLRTTNQLLSVPLQLRKRKTVVYARDLVGPTHIERVAEEEAEADSRNCSVVDSPNNQQNNNNCTSRVDQLVRMYSKLTSNTATTDDDGNYNNDTRYRHNHQHHQINSNVRCGDDANHCSLHDTKSNVPPIFGTDHNEPSTQSDHCDCCSSELNLVTTMRAKYCERDQRQQQQQKQRHLSSHSPVSADEGCAPNLSPYSSSGEEEDSTILSTTHKDERIITNLKPHEKVERSSSSDSALGLDDDILTAADAPSINTMRRMTLTVTDIPLRPALFPIAEPNLLPDSPVSPPPITTALSAGDVINSNQSTASGVVPSKMLLEARIVELPPPPPNSYYRRFSCNPDIPQSRRESSQSYLSDLSTATADEFIGRSRYVRTPSVVVSDYSDDTANCGITLEELEFLRKQRKGSIHQESYDGGDDSDLSAASSCSNLNYCGSTISALDACELLQSLSGFQTPERKTSSCSTCSNVSGGADDEEVFTEQLTEALGREKKKVGENARN